MNRFLYSADSVASAESRGCAASPWIGRNSACCIWQHSCQSLPSSHYRQLQGVDSYVSGCCWRAVLDSSKLSACGIDASQGCRLDSYLTLDFSSRPWDEPSAINSQLPDSPCSRGILWDTFDTNPDVPEGTFFSKTWPPKELRT